MPEQQTTTCMQARLLPEVRARQSTTDRHLSRVSCLAVLCERGRALAERLGDQAVARGLVAVCDGLTGLLGRPLVVLACAARRTAWLERLRALLKPQTQLAHHLHLSDRTGILCLSLPRALHAYTQPGSGTACFKTAAALPMRQCPQKSVCMRSPMTPILQAQKHA